MCQTCVDIGVLEQETFDRIEAFLEEWPDAAYGPGHIVLDDCNLGDGHIQFCLDKLDTYRARDYSTEHTAEELAATREFLEWLLTIPEDDR